MQSAEKRNKFERMGECVLICINEEEVTNEDTISFKYDSVKVGLLDSRNIVIQKLMRVKYPDIDSEIAAISNGGAAVLEHGEWRDTAKLTASEFIDFVAKIFNEVKVVD